MSEVMPLYITLILWFTIFAFIAVIDTKKDIELFPENTIKKVILFALNVILPVGLLFSFVAVIYSNLQSSNNFIDFVHILTLLALAFCSAIFHILLYLFRIGRVD